MSRVPATRRGPVVGRFCLACGGVYGPHQARHAGKAIGGRDHVASPCTHEGESFSPEALWWEPAVETLPPSPVGA